MITETGFTVYYLTKTVLLVFWNAKKKRRKGYNKKFEYYEEDGGEEGKIDLLRKARGGN